MSTIGTSNVIPSTVQQATQQNYLASNAIYDMRKPVIDPNEAQIWGSGDITGLMDKLGGKNYVSSSFYRHFETTRLHTIINATGTTQAALAPVTYTMVSANTIPAYPNAVYDPYIATNATVILLPVRAQDVLIFPGGTNGLGIQGRVDSVNQSAGTFEVYPLGTTDLPTTISTDNIVNIGASNVEGGTMPLSMNFRDNVYYNVTQTMNDVFSDTGTSMAEQMWVTFTNGGVTGNVWTLKGIASTHKRFRNFIELRNVASDPVTNTTTLPNNLYTQTQGLIPFAQSYGNNTTYDIGTGLTLDDYNNLITDQIDKNKGSVENSQWMGILVREQIDAFIRTNMQNGGVQYNALGGTPKAYVDFGFDSFRQLGYTFHDMTYQLFNDPTLLGGIEAYRNLLIGVPMGMDIYKLGDEKEKVSVPPLRMNYKKLGGYSREWEEWPTGGANGVYTNQDDLRTINMRSENGIECFGSKNYFTVQGENQ